MQFRNLAQQPSKKPTPKFPRYVQFARHRPGPSRESIETVTLDVIDCLSWAFIGNAYADMLFLLRDKEERLVLAEIKAFLPDQQNLQRVLAEAAIRALEETLDLGTMKSKFAVHLHTEGLLLGTLRIAGVNRENFKDLEDWIMHSPYEAEFAVHTRGFGKTKFKRKTLHYVTLQDLSEPTGINLQCAINDHDKVYANFMKETVDV